MTLEEYKKQSKAIYEESMNFNGTPEEAAKFFEDLAAKYPEINEFNTKAIECKDVTEFEQLADSFGIKFNSEDSAEKLYSMLNNSSRQIDIDVKGLVNRAELTDEQLASVIGGVNWKKFWKGVGIGLAVVGAVVLTGGVGAAIGGAVGVGTAAASAFVASAATVSVVGAGAAVAAGGAVAAAAGTALAVGMDNLESAAGGVGSDDDIDDSLKIESEL